MSTPTTDTGPEIRLLVCLVCNTIEELPPFEGRPENDHLLEICLEKHQGAAGPHTGHLMKVPVKYWSSESTRKAIIKQIREGTGGISELDPEYYASKSNFAQDAMSCWRAHLSPKDGCPDYMSAAKILLPKTQEMRRDVGLPDPRNAPGPKQYLCRFCPIHSVVMQKRREIAGLYE